MIIVPVPKWLSNILQVALNNLVDSFSTMTIESGLMSKLPELFSAATVMSLDEDTVSEIAAESAGTQEERQALKDKLAVLEKGLKALQRFDRHSSPRCKCIPS